MTRSYVCGLGQRRGLGRMSYVLVECQVACLDQFIEFHALQMSSL